MRLAYAPVRMAWRVPWRTARWSTRPRGWRGVYRGARWSTRPQGWRGVYRGAHWSTRPHGWRGVYRGEPVRCGWRVADAAGDLTDVGCVAGDTAVIWHAGGKVARAREGGAGEGWITSRSGATKASLGGLVRAHLCEDSMPRLVPTRAVRRPRHHLAGAPCILQGGNHAYPAV